MQILYNLYCKNGERPAISDVKISDVSDNEWFAEAAHWVVYNNLADIENNKFNPNSPASREFTWISLYRMIEKNKIDLPYWQFLDEFPDVPYNGSELAKAIKCFQKAEIIGGYPDGLFHGNNNLTRAQMAKILDNYVYAKGKVGYGEGEYWPQRGVRDYYNNKRKKAELYGHLFK